MRFIFNKNNWPFIFTPLGVVFSVASGAFASFYTYEIKHNFLPFWESSTISYKASFFWVFLFLAALCFLINQVALSVRSEQSIQKLDQMVKRLQTLPSDGYLQSYQSSFRVAASNVFLVLLDPATTVDQVNQAIRTVLGSILETARDYDKVGDIKYSANIMIWRESKTNIESKNYLSPVVNALNNPNYSGFLELLPELSTNTSQDANYGVDDLVSALVLPVHNNKSDVPDSNMNLFTHLLPGAPYAFANKIYASFGTINELFTWLDSVCAESLEVKNVIKDYFRENPGARIKSFASLPILLPSIDAPDSEANPIAVLNIHSETENILDDNGESLFQPLLEPFLMLLSTLLLKRTDLLSCGQTIQEGK